MTAIAMFSLREHGTSVRTEILAGCTTYLTMAYIVVVNPLILASAGIDHGAAFVATCIAAAIGSAAMGLMADLPLALAPGMGLNAYFTYTVVKGMGVSWQVALGAVFISGVLFLIVSLLRIREWLVNAIPMSLKLGIGAGIGLFLGLIGLHEMGLVIGNPETLVTLGHLATPATLLACLGFLIIAGLIGARHTCRYPDRHSAHRRVRPAIRSDRIPRRHRNAAIAGADVSAARYRRRAVTGRHHRGSDILPGRCAGQHRHADRHDAARRPDRPDGTIARLREALLADSGGAIIGSLLGTSTTTSYIESAAGIQAGGRTGLTAVTVAVLFLLTLFFAPIATAIPAFATAPALVFVACLMARAMRDINWDDATEYVPAVVLAIGIPFTFSIAAGIGLGFIVYVVVKSAAGQIGAIPGAVWLVAGLSLLKFVLG